MALRIDKHIKGYIDFYFGPKKLRKIVDSESITSPKKLLLDSKTLLKQLEAQGYDKERERYLEKMLIAMRTSIELLIGIEISFKDQFLRLYDVDLQPVNESELENLKEEFDGAYRGSGSLEERLNNLRLKRTIPESMVFVLFKKALNIVKKRSIDLFCDLLPKKERIIIELVKNYNGIRWPYYEIYLGDFTSRVMVNPNYQMYWTTFLSGTAHECYPGHHMEFVLKDKFLYQDLFQFEHSIFLLNSPKLIISEGIASLALNTLFNYRDQAEISLRELCPYSSKEDLNTLIAQNKVKGKFTLFNYNLAYHALIDEWTPQELIQYATNFEVYSDEAIQNRLKMYSNAVYSTTTFSYNIGRNLIVNKFGEFPSVSDFRELLVNPKLPSDLI